MLLGLGLAHFCFDYSHKQAHLSQSAQLQVEELESQSTLGTETHQTCSVHYFFLCRFFSRTDLSTMEDTHHGIIEFLLLDGAHLRLECLCISYGLRSKFYPSLLALRLTVHSERECPKSLQI